MAFLFSRFFLLTGIVAASFTAGAIDLSTIDLSHQYDPEAPIRLQYRVIQEGGKFTVHLNVEFDSLSEWSREFMLQAGYQSEGHRVFTPEIIETGNSNVSWHGKLVFTTASSEQLLIIRYASDFDFYFDIPLMNGNLAFPSFYVSSKEEMILSSFLPTNEIAWSSTEKIHISEYPNKFGPADAPMEEMKALAPSIFEDTTFFASDSLNLKDFQLYYFKNDTLADVGLALLKVPPYYPSLKKINELIHPLKYITTEAEYRTLLRSSRPKKTFDEFWLNTYGTKFRARNAIRKYFRGVELANEYFTGIKEGWKTDQGMIFIVYGTPIEMYRNGRTETWVYENEEYEFIKVSTLFGPIYALRKDKKFEKDWYKQVGDIRRGD